MTDRLSTRLHHYDHHHHHHHQIIKNVVLAGINAALLDHRQVSPRDLNAQFYLRPEDVGKNVRT